MREWDAGSMTAAEWRALMESWGEKPFRSTQVYAWLHKKHAGYEDMSNLPGALRDRLMAEMPLYRAEVALVQRSSRDDTRKYLMTLHDREQVESVLMRYKYGYSICISSQVGCRMGCRFCASTLEGKKRDLTAGEMLAQIDAAEAEAGVGISHVVVMGCGEPFDNYEALMRFLALANDPDGRGLSMRNITVSTCGLVDRMRQFADEKLGVTLAVSLHAPNDEIRKRIMPIANRVSMDELLEACRYYTGTTHRRITFEYALIRDVNDQPAHAAELAGRLMGMLAHVNLIPLNPVAEREWRGSSSAGVRAFYRVLEEAGVPVTIRREMGQEIDAACGQLRRRKEE